MNKALALFLILAGLAAFVHAADVAVQVGGNNAGENVFIPAMINAAPGDNIVFTWKTGKHSIVESDEAKSCVKSVKPTAFSSGGAFEAGKTWTYPVPKDATGKGWFFCGVEGHCAGGMYATIVYGAAGAAPPADAPKDAPKDGAKDAPKDGAPSTPAGASPSAGAAPTDAKTAAASRNYNSLFSAGVVFSSMCMAAAYML
jgi:plastocyanin